MQKINLFNRFNSVYILNLHLHFAVASFIFFASLVVCIGAVAQLVRAPR